MHTEGFRWVAMACLALAMSVALRLLARWRMHRTDATLKALCQASTRPPRAVPTDTTP